MATTALAQDVYVNGYYRSDGTYVQPYYRTRPNRTTLDNYSTKGNVNPYTGQPGTHDPSIAAGPAIRIADTATLAAGMAINPAGSLTLTTEPLSRT